MQQYIEAAGLLATLPAIKGTSIYANFDGLDFDHGAALIYGWAFDAASPDSTPEILVFGSTGIIGRGKADLARPDVNDAGVPRVEVGFRVRLKPRANERKLKIVVDSGKQQHILLEIRLTENLPTCVLTREDVISVFGLLFHRIPESDDAINHQLSVHRSKDSLFAALFRSPEFHEKNMDVIALLRANTEGN
ncbi:hypothetical protein [Azospirillum sp. TSH64]|uniref:hypothetical protein n=1 Tax=Azospirillum sp. TSH64 TaxID=652740 RepID=UPI0011B1D4E7|nr:hypothetical protein [Azospirillum sp. TSH64]